MNERPAGKCSDTKGFTLVEVIVVLVILAILAAILIPAMTGWIDKAKEKRLLLACRTCVLAAQTLADQQYGRGDALNPPKDADVKNLARVDGTVSDVSYVSGSVQIHHLTYRDGTDSVTYCSAADDHPEHYNFSTGGGATLSTGEAGAQMGQSLTAISQGDISSLEGNISSIYSSVDSAWKTALLASLSPEARAALDGKTWKITSEPKNLQSTDSYKLVVYDGDISGLSTGTRLSVTIYDLKTGTSRPGTSYVGTSGVQKILGYTS